MFKSHFAETVTIVIAVVMGFIMAFSVIVVNHLELNPSNLFQIWSMVTLTIILVSIVIPYKNLSVRFTALFCLPKGHVAYPFINNIVPSLILNTFNTMIVSAANVFFNETIPVIEQANIWVSGIVHDWPIMFVISYFSAFMAEAVGEAVARHYCSAGVNY